MMCAAQDDDPSSHRGTQFATTGTDFWVCFPRTQRGMMPNFSRIYVASERDCDVTVRNELFDYTQTYHVARRRMCGPETNYVQIPIQYTRINDTVHYLDPKIPRHDYSGILGDLPQPRGFHVTSTDTVSLYIVVAADHMTACTVLPTEMLRDEYIAQPPIVSHHSGVNATLKLPQYMPGMSSIDIVAVDDSVTVDIVLSDWDWLNRRPGDTLTVTLRRGELYHLSAGEVQEKYYPLFAPYYNPSNDYQDSPQVQKVKVQPHNFTGDSVMRDTFAVDLAGTRIKARDCKRIAVFESTSCGGGGKRGDVSFNMKMEQSIPLSFLGKDYLVPAGEGKTIRMTAPNEDATVTIRDLAHPSYGSRTLTIPSGKTDWWEGESDSGPYYIVSDKPLLVKWIENDICTMTPVGWWHGGQTVYGTLTNVVPINNVTMVHSQLHIFTRTENVSTMYMDSYRLDTSFTELEGTPYSHAYFNWRSHFNSMGTHNILSRGSKPFMAFLQSGGCVELQHLQPGAKKLMVNGVDADSLSADSIWCLYDPVTFKATNQRPCDSLIWDFGDGTVLRLQHDDPAFAQPQVHTWQDTGRYTVSVVFKYEDEGCFTRKPDTLSAPLWFHNHHDSLISVRLCEGSYFFKGHELDRTDTHHFTTYWTESGCDTLWRIDLVTCPHCHWEYDTVAPGDLPVTFNDLLFGSECHDEPIHLHIADTCDSIIYYTLIVIPHWGEKPVDSTWVLAPNVITPGQEGNNLFALTCSHHIVKAEVTVFDRRGVLIAQFDGLTGSWDGTSQGKTVPQGTYVYRIRYIDTADRGWKTLNGTVTLLR